MQRSRKSWPYRRRPSPSGSGGRWLAAEESRILSVGEDFVFHAVGRHAVFLLGETPLVRRAGDARKLRKRNPLVEFFAQFTCTRAPSEFSRELKNVRVLGGRRGGVEGFSHRRSTSRRTC
eukprot:1391697-Rhodomonas_salina.1